MTRLDLSDADREDRAESLAKELRRERMADDERRFPNAADGEAWSEHIDIKDALDREQDYLDASDF